MQICKWLKTAQGRRYLSEIADCTAGAGRGVDVGVRKQCEEDHAGTESGEKTAGAGKIIKDEKMRDLRVFSVRMEHPEVALKWKKK